MNEVLNEGLIFRNQNLISKGEVTFFIDKCDKIIITQECLGKYLVKSCCECEWCHNCCKKECGEKKHCCCDENQNCRDCHLYNIIDLRKLCINIQSEKKYELRIDFFPKPFWFKNKEGWWVRTKDGVMSLRIPYANNESVLFCSSGYVMLHFSLYYKGKFIKCLKAEDGMHGPKDDEEEIDNNSEESN